MCTIMLSLRVKATAFFVAASILSIVIHAENQSAHLPIVLVSGIKSDYVNMEPTAELIRTYLPDTYIKCIDIGLGKITSFWNLYDQGEWFAHEIYDDYNLRDGFNIIAHSQGGLTARYYIERFNNPPVYNYISLGTPQRGVCGMPGNMDTKYVWLNLLEAYASSILYLPFFQSYVSFAGYWNDSLQHVDYLEKCSFLPYLNNEIEHELAALFKENLCSINNMVLVKSINEEIIDPIESCHFGFYKQGSISEIEDLFSSEIYLQDTLGLKELHETGRLHLREADCCHTDFREDEQNFINNILPFLIELPEKESPTVTVQTEESPTINKGT